MNALMLSWEQESGLHPLPLLLCDSILLLPCSSGNMPRFARGGSPLSSKKCYMKKARKQGKDPLPITDNLAMDLSWHVLHEVRMCRHTTEQRNSVVFFKNSFLQTKLHIFPLKTTAKKQLLGYLKSGMCHKKVVVVVVAEAAAVVS